MAALASMKPKKSAYKVQAHPVRSNLLSIVPVEPEKLKNTAVTKPPTVSRALPPVKSGSPNSSKFRRFADDRSSDSELSEEEVEIEEVIEVSETDDEATAEAEAKRKQEEEEKKKALKKRVSVSGDTEDVLNIGKSKESLFTFISTWFLQRRRMSLPTFSMISRMSSRKTPVKR